MRIFSIPTSVKFDVAWRNVGITEIGFIVSITEVDSVVSGEMYGVLRLGSVYKVLEVILQMYSGAGLSSVYRGARLNSVYSCMFSYSPVTGMRSIFYVIDPHRRDILKTCRHKFFTDGINWSYCRMQWQSL